ncbi:hypothetical protein RZN25_09885 [Bacillaceae bacterium S4-13-56]
MKRIKSWIQNKLFILLPVILLMLFFSFSFFITLDKISEQPSENFSRSTPVGKITSKNIPWVENHQDGSFSIYTYFDLSPYQIDVNADLSVANQKKLALPIDEWDTIYKLEDKLYYLKRGTLYTEKGEELLNEIETSAGKENVLLLSKGQAVYQLNLKNNSVRKVISDIPTHREILFPSEDTLAFINRTENNGEIHIYQIKNGNYNFLKTENVKTPPGRNIKEVDVLISNNKISIVVGTVLQKQADHVFNAYYDTHNLDEDTQLKELSLIDPVTGGIFLEFQDFSIINETEGKEIVFTAYGNTVTKDKDGLGFNIYKAVISNDNVDVVKLSDTLGISAKPFQANDEVLIWMEYKNGYNNLLAGSSNQDAMNRLGHATKEDATIALGLVLSSYTKSFFIWIFTATWYLFPMIFFVVIMVFKRGFLDQDLHWVTYVAVALYMIAALLQQDRVFTPGFEANAPAFLSFPGSSYVWIFVSGIIAWIFLRLSKIDWSTPVKAFYFIFVHILFLSALAGPYLL